MLAGNDVGARVDALPKALRWQAQRQTQGSIVFKTWPETMGVHRTAFANPSKYHLPLASVVLPPPGIATLYVEVSP
jgi:hypothetical protein